MVCDCLNHHYLYKLYVLLLLLPARVLATARVVVRRCGPAKTSRRRPERKAVKVAKISYCRFVLETKYDANGLDVLFFI